MRHETSDTFDGTIIIIMNELQQLLVAYENTYSIWVSLLQYKTEILVYFATSSEIFSATLFEKFF